MNDSFLDDAPAPLMLTKSGSDGYDDASDTVSAHWGGGNSSEAGSAETLRWGDLQGPPLELSSSATDPRRRGLRGARTVRAGQGLLLLLLSGVGIGVTVGTWVVLSRQEDARYLEGYRAFTGSIHGMSLHCVDNLHRVTRGLARAITTCAAARNETFPFVTVDGFPALGRQAVRQAGVEGVLFSPLVGADERADWEAYSVAQQGWIQSGWDQYRELDRFDAMAPGATIAPIAPYIWSQALEPLDGATAAMRAPEPPDSGPYLPLWMISPLPQSGAYFINANRLGAPSMEEQYYFSAGVAREGVFSQVLAFAHQRAERKPVIDLDNDTHGESNGAIETEAGPDMSLPHSFLIEPVFDRIDDMSSNIVGFVEALVLWDQYLTNLVPDGVHGITTVIQNTCGQSFTFILNGTQPWFIGKGDLHDVAYNATAVNVPLYNYQSHNITHFLDGHCEYDMTIYASAEYESQAKSNRPAIVMTVSAIISLLVLLVFVIYDSFRHNSLIDAANGILSPQLQKQKRCGTALC